jgi:putative serine protease PepD
VTDGRNWRPGQGRAPDTPAAPGPATPPGRPPPGAWTAASVPSPPADSPWWSDAANDPWRNPQTPAAVVVRASVDGGTEPEPVVDPDAAPSRGIGTTVLISILSALLAGALGGALGYAFAVRGGAGGSRAVLGAGPAASAPALAQRPPDSLAGIAARLLPSVVTVRVAGGGASSVGSGFLVTADGYIVTNDHVVAGGSKTSTIVFSDGSTGSGSLVGTDPESDIAVIKVSKSGLTPVEFGDSDGIAVGDPVLAIGSPLALANTVTSGIVSAVDRTIQSGEPGGTVRYYAAIQTDAAVNQGNSGGPLVDGGGRVVGVNSVIKSLATQEDQAGNIGLAFAIPINQAKRVTRDIIDTGKARRTVIGAQVGDAGRAPGSGVRLDTVEPGGPAAAAGLKPGDVVTKLDGHGLEEPSDLIALVRKYAPGAVVTIEYRRGSAAASASVTLAADPG